jgi:ribosomal protein S7
LLACWDYRQFQKKMAEARAYSLLESLKWADGDFGTWRSYAIKKKDEIERVAKANR